MLEVFLSARCAFISPRHIESGCDASTFNDVLIGPQAVSVTSPNIYSERDSGRGQDNSFERVLRFRGTCVLSPCSMTACAAKGQFLIGKPVEEIRHRRGSL